MNEPTQGTGVLDTLVNPGGVTHHANTGAGGIHEVPTLLRRNIIPVSPEGSLHYDGYGSGRRRVGMLVTVTDGAPSTWLTYRLEVAGYEELDAQQRLAALADNTNWQTYPQNPTDGGNSSGNGGGPSNITIKQGITQVTELSKAGEPQRIVITPTRAGILEFADLTHSLRRGQNDYSVWKRESPFFSVDNRLFLYRFREEVLPGESITVELYPTGQGGPSFLYVEAKVLAPSSTDLAILNISFKQNGILKAKLRLSAEAAAANYIALILSPEGNEELANLGNYYQCTVVGSVTPTDEPNIYEFTGTSYELPAEYAEFSAVLVPGYLPLYCSLKAQLSINYAVLDTCYPFLVNQNMTHAPYALSAQTSTGASTLTVKASGIAEYGQWAILLASVDENGQPDYQFQHRLNFSTENTPHNIGTEDISIYALPADPTRLLAYGVNNFGAHQNEGLAFDWPGFDAIDPTPRPLISSIAYEPGQDTLTITYTAYAEGATFQLITFDSNNEAGYLADETVYNYGSAAGELSSHVLENFSSSALYAPGLELSVLVKNGIDTKPALAYFNHLM